MSNSIENLNENEINQISGGGFVDSAKDFIYSTAGIITTTAIGIGSLALICLFTYGRNQAQRGITIGNPTSFRHDDSYAKEIAKHFANAAVHGE